MPANETSPSPKLSAIFEYGWIAFIVVCTAWPYLSARLAVPDGYHYTWVIPPYPADSFHYLALSRQAAEGALLFKIKFTAIPHKSFLFHPIFWVCGVLGSLTGLDLGVVHLLVKSLGVVLFFLVLYRFIRSLGLDAVQSAAATLMTGVSSGFGGLLVKFLGSERIKNFRPVDLWLLDSNTFWSMLWGPIFPYSLALIVLAIHLLNRGTLEARRRDAWESGLSVGVLALIHPYQVPLLYGFAVVLFAIRRRPEVRRLILPFFAASAPFVLGQFLLSRLHPLASMHSLTGAMKSPPVSAYLLGFGFPLILAVAGFAVDAREQVRRHWPLLLWISLALSMAYLPVWFQRKLIIGVHVPICVLAGAAFGRFWAWSGSRRGFRILAAFAAVVLLPLSAYTQLVLYRDHKAKLAANVEGAYWIPDDVMEAMDHLKKNSSPDDVVFALGITNLFIPAYSGNTVVWGHWALSVDAKEKAALYRNVLRPDSGWDDRTRRDRFWESGVDYVFLDGDLKRWFERTKPRWLTRDTERIFENGSVAILKRISR